jgi:transposase
MAAREKGRLASPALTRPARRSVERTIRLLEKEADRVRAEDDALVAASEALRADRELLESIPGVGRQTATTVLAELPALEQLPSAQSAAASAGLAPREYPLRDERAQADAAVQGGQRPAAQGPVPAYPDGEPLQPPP